MGQSEFELLRDLRALRRPADPADDLWPGIAARLVPAQAPARRRTMWPEALAASMVLGLGLLLGAGLGGPSPVPGDVAPAGLPWSVREARTLDAAFGAALHEARRDLPPASGEIARADRELDAAQRSLERALAEQPDAVHLLDLLRRTHEQRLRLAQRHAGIG